MVFDLLFLVPIHVVLGSTIFLEVDLSMERLG